MKGPLPAGHALLAAMFLATFVTARSPDTLFERDSTCPDTSQSQCAQPGLPDNFCCPSTATCIPLAGNTTVLCCPSGNNCNIIKPIICDVSAQNVTLNNANTLKTTALTIPLPTCGGQCCPFGYSCNSDKNCVMNQDQQDAPSSARSSSSSSPSSATSAPATSRNPSPSSTTTSSSSTNTPVVITPSCDKFPVTAVLAGFFPGLAAGILLSIAGVCILGSRRRKAARRRSGSSFGNISEPQASSDMRTDFLRKPPQTPSTIVASTPERRYTVQRVKSLFRKTPSSPGQSPRLAPPPPLNVQRPMAQNNRAVTPPLQREPSYEDINIFADGDTASALRERERGNGRANAGGLAPPGAVNMRGSHQTTFSDMMERSGLAGLQKGQPYVYKRESPGFTPPR
ncbi:hypothetical protein ONS95_007994 [Cadophora gregata]|uniref:uncharacterized protein n=1 Tax=Cadophora gregata TaxID=51156 RepID=UPI0026DBC9C4|nr:uncharacterized protein ONS95_007994 [Cadophora gregata]KAK0119132.1 hypothetical protein ONS96_012199 [Cadophora gregata f. sp. sojae]KAK0126388.1 hypothetical protein ONS95_007994 [Cadophora gregata]